MHKLQKFGISVIFFLVPGVAFAQPANFSEFVDVLLDILSATVPVIFGITILAILWAGAQMILHADNEQKRADGKRTLMWGVIVLFVMVSMWGFVNLIRSSVLL